MTKWKNIPDNIEQYQGFVYCITNLINGKYYIGKKFYWKQIRRKPLKGNKRVRLDRVESDWKHYFGSSKKLLTDISKYGKQNFKREIIYNCDNKFECAYMELREQLKRDVLFDKNAYNEIINVRLRKG